MRVESRVWAAAIAIAIMQMLGIRVFCVDFRSVALSLLSLGFGGRHYTLNNTLSLHLVRTVMTF